MVTITRNNYEEFFLDYIEGEISAQNKEALESFLAQNPDLKQELDEMMDTDFACNIPTSATDSSSLKEIPFKANFDDFCIAHLEDDLDSYENEAFEEFIASHPKKKNELGLFYKTKLTSDSSITYRNKKGLKKKNKAIVFRQFVFTTLATAASIAILFSVWTTEIESETSNLDSNLISHNSPIIIASPDTVKKPITKELKELKNFDNESKSKEIKKPLKTKIKGKSLNKQIIKQDALPIRAEISKEETINKIEVKQLLASHKIIPIENSPQEIEKLAEIKEANTNQNSGLAMLGLSWKTSKGEKEVKEKSTLLKIASYGVSQIGKIAGKKINLEKKYDPKTDKTRVAFNTMGIGFSTPVK